MRKLFTTLATTTLFALGLLAFPMLADAGKPASLCTSGAKICAPPGQPYVCTGGKWKKAGTKCHLQERKMPPAKRPARAECGAGAKRCIHKREVVCSSMGTWQVTTTACK